MMNWMERMGIAYGGETARALREQAARISACSLKFFWESDAARVGLPGASVTSGLRFNARLGDQGNSLGRPRSLDELFFRAIQEHPVSLAGGSNPRTSSALDVPRHLRLAGVASA